MIIQNLKPNSFNHFSKKYREKKQSFGKESPPKQKFYKVVNQNIFKKVLPTLAFTCSAVGAAGYLLGGTGLFYDIFHERNVKKSNAEPVKGFIQTIFTNKKDEKNKGVKTITANTDIGKLGITCAKTAITATAAAGMACGLGEGIPLMALGEATNLSAAKIIETPIGTGLFGIGIASVFAGLALDNTPELKLNEFDLMAAKGLKEKSILVLKNMKDTAKEISGSIFDIAKNSYKPSFWKENIFRITPKTVVFSERINKDGVVTLTKELRHNKNYLMHAASFTLGIGGIGLILTSLLKQKKAQKTGLKVEEGGFLCDNLGMTKYGIDKFTTGGKSTGASFAIGGIINTISQFVGLDNKNGRALQWLGIAGVFLGYTIDRGKHLKTAIQNSKQRPELTRVVREWKFDLTNIIKDNKDLNKLLKEIKAQSIAITESKEIPPITNETFNNFEKDFTHIIDGKFKKTEDIKNSLSKKYQDYIQAIPEEKGVIDIKNPDEAKEILRISTVKLFGSENPSAIIEKK